MFYLGLDVHGKWSTIKGFDPSTGEQVVVRRVPNQVESFVEVLGAWRGPFHGAMEAGTNSWAMYRLLSPLFARLIVVHPPEVHDRRDGKAKTDPRDAMALAVALCRGELQGIYIPDEHTQDLRTLVRGRVRATRWVTKLTNEIGSLLRGWGYVGERSLLSKRGPARLDEAALPQYSARVLALLRGMWELAQQVEQELDEMVGAAAAADPECERLMSMPEVGPFTSLLLRAEIGKLARFGSGKQLIGYAGLAPRVFQSGEHCHYGRISKRGNSWMRYAMLLLANRVAAGRGNSRLHRLYRRLCFSQHSNDAKMAVARKALLLAYHLLRRGEYWEEEQARTRKVS